MLPSSTVPWPVLLWQEDFEDFFKQLGQFWIISNDQNAKHLAWGSLMYSPHGHILCKAVVCHNCHPVTSGKSTYWPTNINKWPNVINFFLMKGLPMSYIQCHNIANLSSDRVLVLMQYQSTLVFVRQSYALANNSTNWNLYCKLVPTNWNEMSGSTLWCKTPPGVSRNGATLPSLNTLLH